MKEIGVAVVAPNGCPILIVEAEPRKAWQTACAEVRREGGRGEWTRNRAGAAMFRNDDYRAFEIHSDRTR